jgi:hypothetical protein
MSAWMAAPEGVASLVHEEEWDEDEQSDLVAAREEGALEMRERR